jgi:tetratricopeptide (TPR) repeat protein
MKPAAAIVRAVIVVVGALLVFALIGNAHPQSASSEIDLGAQAYRQGKYAEAEQHFEKAVSLEPTNTVAHLYLATVCAQQYIPGVDTPENTSLGEKAVGQYQTVLDANPTQEQRVNSAKGIAYIYLNMKKFEDAKTYYRMAADADPDDPESYYSLGVIDWTECYQPRMEAREKLGVKPEDNLNPANDEQRRTCDELRAKNTPAIEDGIDMLGKAIKLRPDYDDAMAYMNLMYRERADLECDDLAARARDLATADHWVDKTLAVKKKKFSPQSREYKQDQSQEQSQPQQK